MGGGLSSVVITQYGTYENDSTMVWEDNSCITDCLKRFILYLSYVAGDKGMVCHKQATPSICRSVCCTCRP